MERLRPAILVALGLSAFLYACDRGTATPAPATSALRAFDQFVADEKVSVGDVVTGRPAWVAIWQRRAGTPVLLGKTRVEAGTHQTVSVEVADAFSKARLAHGVGKLKASLHRDGGVQGTFEYDEAADDAPDHLMIANEREVAQSFFAFRVPEAPQSHIIVQDQEIRGRTLLLEEVKASEPAEVLIHRSRGEVPLVPKSIGEVSVEAGLHRRVSVQLAKYARVDCGEELWPMLHVRSTSDRQAYSIDQPIVTASFIHTCDR